MADVKQILVVDDHFEMLEFLRSMLELSNREYEVLGVPSAEEAYMELRRVPFDLLITDVRLPGMSGFELVRRIRPVRPEMPVIMITAYSSAQGRQEAAELNVFRYFQKPLDADSLLASVRGALHGGMEPLRDTLTVSVFESIKGEREVSDEVVRCLTMLQTDTGAAQAILATSPGRVVFATEGQLEVDVAQLARLVAGGLETSLEIAALLQSDEPLTIQYQAGQRYDLYLANVGRSHMVMLVFDAQMRRGRIGTVWVFTQRAIKELLTLLPTPAGNQTAAAAPSPAPPAKKQASPPPPALTQTTAPPRPELAKPAPGPAPAPAPEPVLTPEMKNNPLFNLFSDQDAATDVDLDAFWEEATGNPAGGEATSGLSFEEARRQGLIPPELES
ncbi:MAG: response regulator [Ardenticatenaceae bacterium]|nr:response regulator [Ardenticatenaceae bacterium]